MRSPDDEDKERLILDGVDDSVLALSDAVPVLPRQLLASSWAWIVSQSLNPLHDPLPDRLLRDRLDLSNRRWLDLDAISCHCASGT